jgi:hypothetical protein
MQAERGGRLLHLVRLQMADQVPSQISVGRGSDLLQSLLHLVLAEVELAGGAGRSRRVRAEGLGDGDEADGARIPAGAAGGRVDPGPDVAEVVRDGALERHTSVIS